MNSLLYYLLQVVVASGLLYLYYHIALRNKKFHQYNRFYLLGAVLISMLAPFLNIPVYFSPQQTESSIVLQTLTVISEPAIDDPARPVSVAEPVVISRFDPVNLLYYGYALLGGLVLLRIIISLFRIQRLKRAYAIEKIGGIYFVNTNEPGTPFSFFRWLFWNKNIELRSEKGEQVFRHELFHIQQKHSIDLLFMELLTVIFWINPFFHLMKKELRTIHEFLADQFAINKSNRWDYAELLLMQALQTKHTLVNPFFHNQIKRRIAMITNSEKTSYRYLRKLLVLPVAVLIITVFAFKYKKANTDTVIRSEAPITIVIDAGHGGPDPGAKSPDNKFNEAQLSLELAKTIQDLSHEYNIKVVMTRQDDDLPGAAVTNEKSLPKRIEIANEVNPAAFISIHMNSTTGKEFQEKLSGIEAYVSAKRDDKNGKKIASAILQELSSVYKTAKELKSRDNNGIYVLDHTSYPAIVLQCGYITNAADLAFITDKANQEKIARKILTALSAYEYPSSVGIVTMNGGIISIDSTKSGTINIEDSSRFFLRKGGAIFITNEKIIVHCDTMIDHITKDNRYGSENSLIVIDGKKKPLSYLGTRTFHAKEIHSYSKNHPGAIQLYGKEAAKGLILMKGVTILSDLPPYEYYEIDKQLSNRASQDTDKVFTKVEIDAQFPGGEKAFRTFLEKNLDGNVPFNKHAQPGTYTVFIQFIVDKEGNPRDFKALTAHEYGMEEEVMRVLKKVPKWVPAIQNGRAVNAYKKQAVTFRITKEDNKTTASDKSLSDIVMTSYSASKKTTKVLGEVYIEHKYGKRKIEKMETPVEAGSEQWKLYLLRNLDGIAVYEDRKSAQYKLFVHFAADENGNITDIMVRNYSGSKVATHCRELFRNIPRIIIPADMVQGVTTFYIQPVTFSTFPAIVISDLKKITPHQLLDLDMGTEIKTFTFTIDLPSGDIVHSVNYGNKFNDETLKVIKEAASGRLITVESIGIVLGGKEAPIPSRLYFVIESAELLNTYKIQENERQTAALISQDEKRFYNNSIL